MSGKTPYLNNPAPGWRHDLPGLGESPDISLVLMGAHQPINYIDNYCLEIPSPSLNIRGVIFWAGALNLVGVSTGLWTLITLLGRSEASIGIIALLLFAAVGALGISILAIRLDLFLPRDEPIRFNRARQKVYFYHFRYSWLHPLSKTKWGVEISVHDWDELWLEACRSYGIEGGASTQRIQISPQKNRTRDKRNSRIFSHSIRTGEAYWAMIRLYMQQGHQALPPFKNPPQPRQDEEMFYNIFWDYAPRVVWPADIDLESRTPPSPENNNDDR